MPPAEYQFTNGWFHSVRAAWDVVLPGYAISRVLEIGSFEGASTCYFIEHAASRQVLELHCVDTWDGGIEHQPGAAAPTNMAAVEQRFMHNVQVARRKVSHDVELYVHKATSAEVLPRLLAADMAGYFDCIYVDGSHQAPDVLFDAVMAHRLLKVGGLLIFDDYLWAEPLPGGVDPLRCPKPAIDAFTQLYARKIRILRAPLYQLYVQKSAD